MTLKSILDKIFNSLQDLVEFLCNKYDLRETVYEAQARLAYIGICQKNDEKVSAYAIRLRNRQAYNRCSKTIDAQTEEVKTLKNPWRNI